jgi:hypothetical protein
LRRRRHGVGFCCAVLRRVAPVWGGMPSHRGHREHRGEEGAREGRWVRLEIWHRRDRGGGVSVPGWHLASFCRFRVGCIWFHGVATGCTVWVRFAPARVGWQVWAACGRFWRVGDALDAGGPRWLRFAPGCVRGGQVGTRLNRLERFGGVWRGLARGGTTGMPTLAGGSVGEAGP